MILNCLNDKELPVYGDGMNVRDWIYVIDHNRAVEIVFENGKAGEVYNVGAENEMPNIKIVELIIDHMNKSKDLMRFVKDRPGHDKRYAIDASKIKNELGWKADFSFEQAIKDTIAWYIDNKKWWERIISGEYQEYYRKQYSL